MIGRISGIIIDKTPPTICIDVGGVGYEIDVPMTTLYGLPNIGEKATLFTHLAVRDDAHSLYGFTDNHQRTAFRTLIKVSGIGARTALAILSGMTVDELAQAISNQQSAHLLSIPGIGKKTAERLLLELRDKIQPSDNIDAGASSSQNSNDILDALMALGYSNKEAIKAIKKIPADASTTDGIRLALQQLSQS